MLANALGAQGSLTPIQQARARTLIAEQLPCLGCHELDGVGGRTAPSLTTVGQRRSAQYIRDIVTDPQARAPGAAMPRHLMPDGSRELVIRLLADRASGAEVPQPPSPAPAVEARPDGPALYAKWCASCHGTTGAGDGPDARRLPVAPARHADPAAMALRPDDSLYDVIAAGGMPWGRSVRMPAFGASLRAPEIRALVSHIRSLCSCEGPPWSRPTPAAIR